MRQWMEQEKNAVLQKAGNLETGCMAAKECPKIHCWKLKNDENLLRNGMRIFRLHGNLQRLFSWWWNQIHKVCSILEAESSHMLIMIRLVLAPKWYSVFDFQNILHLIHGLPFPKGGYLSQKPSHHKIFAKKDLSEVFNTDEVRNPSG